MNRSFALALVIATASAFGSTGCIVGDEPSGTEPTDEDLPPELSEAGLSNNSQTAFNYFVSKGLTEEQAAGVVGNLMQESGVRPTSVQLGGGPGRGIAQWSVGGRWDTLVAYAAQRGISRWALNTQLDFTWYELTVVGGYGYDQLRSATTVSAAVIAFQNRFEICGVCEQSKRIQYAEEALAAYGADSGNSGPGEAGTTETCYSGTLDREMPENACVESMYNGLWYQCDSGQWIDRWSDPDPCNGEYPL